MMLLTAVMALEATDGSMVGRLRVVRLELSSMLLLLLVVVVVLLVLVRTSSGVIEEVM
jgi:hypothetical protein